MRYTDYTKSELFNTKEKALESSLHKAISVFKRRNENIPHVRYYAIESANNAYLELAENSSTYYEVPELIKKHADQ